jgi:putative acyl-CoA dehydrogenase
VNHEVLNQPPPLADYNLFAGDRALREAVAREGGGWACSILEELGRRLGTAEVMEWAALANEYPPVLHTHDRYGRRRDEVHFHPAWHNLMRLSVEHGIHNLPWAQPRAGAHVARAALAMLALENEAGHVCPISMTYSAVPVLRLNPELAAEWEPRIHATGYDPSFRPAWEKSGALIGMAMTEKQGGSDVRANITRAEPAGDGTYLIDGHKWFCSAPMCDAFLVLAQAPGGLSCFFLPRWTPDGRRNGMEIQRLKSKLGNRSNASAEVEFHGAWARLVGEQGRGVPTIIEMVQHTRLDCTLGSAALMRRALIEALHHCRYRQAFGRRLIEHALMRNVLADLSIESEAATVLALRVARAFDERDTAFARLAVAVAKYWTCRRAPMHVAEALECLGGNGYVEESVMPRLYRETPVNSIWEGSGNVIVLDALRTVTKEPESLEQLFAEIRLARDPRIEKAMGTIGTEVAESEGRRAIERMATALQASLLIRFSHPAVADAFCASRLEGDGGRAFGTLGKSVAVEDVIAGAGLEG